MCTKVCPDGSRTTSFLFFRFLAPQVPSSDTAVLFEVRDSAVQLVLGLAYQFYYCTMFTSKEKKLFFSSLLWSRLLALSEPR